MFVFLFFGSGVWRNGKLGLLVGRDGEESEGKSYIEA